MTRPGRYPVEVRERAVRLVREHEGEYPSQWAAIISIATKCGMTPETLRKWVRGLKSTAVHVRASPPRNVSGCRPWSARTASCGAPTRSSRRRRLFRAGARPATAEMSRFIDGHRGRFGVEPICRELQVGPSTYYAARCRPPSARQVRDEALKVKLRHVHAEHFSVYGARKLWRQLYRDGVPAARCTVND